MVFFCWNPFVFRWVFVALRFLGPLWAICNICCTPNVHPHHELWNLQRSYLLMHGIILHAFHNLHHLLIGHGNLTPLQDGIVSPRLQAMKECHLLCVLFLHWNEAQEGHEGLDISPHRSWPIRLAQIQKFLPIFQDLVMWGELLIQLGLEHNPGQGPYLVRLGILLCHPPFQGMILQKRLCQYEVIHICVDHL